jgi:putative ABC transport system permease protein
VTELRTSELRLATRLARREVRRRPGRTALVAVLVALPVAFMVFQLVLYRTEDGTQEEAWRRQYGDRVDAIVQGGVVDASWMPAGARTATGREAELYVTTGDGPRTRVVVHGLSDAADPMLAGLVELVDGRYATAGDEIALEPDLADELDVGVGDSLALDRPSSLELAVVGLVEKPSDLSLPLGVTTADAALLEADPRRPALTTTYVELPDAAAVEQLRGRASVLVRGDFIEDAEGFSNALVVVAYVLGVITLTVFGIVIAAAFAARSRRQLVTLGQLSANGAPGRVLRMTLVLQGTVTGLVGSLAGLMIVVGVLVLGRGWVEAVFQRRIPRYDIRPVELAGAVAIGVAAATVAALVPAWRVERMSTLAALAGRRPLRPVRHRVTAAGVAAVAIGIGLLGLAVLGGQTGENSGVWALVASAGGIIELLGACAVAPAVVSRLEPLATHTRGTVRLAARSLARERARTGAVVSAVAAAAGLAVAVTALVAGAEAGAAAADPPVSDRVVVATEVSRVTDLSYEEDPASPRSGGELYAPPDAAVQRELTTLLPAADRLTLRTAGHQSDWPDIRVPIVADDAVVDALDLGDDVRRGLARTGLVVIGSRGDVPDQATLPGGRAHDVAAVGGEHDLGALSGVVVSPDLVEQLDVELHDAAVAYVNDRPLTTRQRAEVEAFGLDWELDQAVSSRRIVAIPPGRGPTPVQRELIVAGVAFVFAVLVVGATLALAAAESRDERDVLTVTGVAPRMLARAAGARAWLLAAIGAGMALPVGLLPVAVLVAADDGPRQFVMPWRTVALLAVVLPVAAAAVACVASATAQRLRPVRVSTALFE